MLPRTHVDVSQPFHGIGAFPAGDERSNGKPVRHGQRLAIDAVGEQGGWVEPPFRAADYA